MFTTFALLNSIRAAFGRREKGLRFISKLRSSVFQLYLAHATWNFGGGSDVDVSGFDRLGHSDEVINILMDILRDLSRLLNLPCVTRSVCASLNFPMKIVHCNVQRNFRSK